MGIVPLHFTDLFGCVVIWKSHPCGLTSWEHYGNPIPPFFQSMTEPQTIGGV